jgi:hypothetical protein
MNLPDRSHATATPKQAYAAPVLAVHGTARELTQGADIKDLQDAKGILASCMIVSSGHCCW